MTPTRVLLVDDQDLIRQGLRKLLELEETIEVIGDAADGVAALTVLRDLSADVALVDARMPRMDGVELIRRLSAEYPGIACLVLSTFDEDEYVLGALRAGARGYLLKDCSPDDLVQGIHAAHGGQTLLAGPAAARVVASLNVPGAGAGPGPASGPGTNAGPGTGAGWSAAGRSSGEEAGGTFPGADRLSARERDVVRMIVAGRANREIAATLHLTEGTVKNHVSSSLRKLGLRDRVQLALHASRSGAR